MEHLGMISNGKPKQITHNPLKSSLASGEQCSQHLRVVKYVAVGHSNSNLLADYIMEPPNANSIHLL